MIDLHSLRPSQHRHRYKRVGRGNSSGKGTTAGRGTKGQRARTGGRNKLTRRGLKHLIERTPKTRGFLTRRHRPAVMSLNQLAGLPDQHLVTANDLARRRMITTAKYGLKIIGHSPMKKKLTVKANTFSAGAAAAIIKAGGQAIVVGGKKDQPPTEKP